MTWRNFKNVLDGINFKKLWIFFPKLFQKKFLARPRTSATNFSLFCSIFLLKNLFLLTQTTTGTQMEKKGYFDTIFVGSIIGINGSTMVAALNLFIIYRCNSMYLNMRFWNSWKSWHKLYIYQVMRNELASDTKCYDPIVKQNIKYRMGVKSHFEELNH